MSLRFSRFAILESVGVLVGLFYATLLLLSLWYSLRPITPVFTLSVDPPNWTLPNSDTRVMSLNEGIQIESVARYGEYMLLTADIVVGRPRRMYSVAYELKQLDGATIIGIFDNGKHAWINSRLIGQAKDELFFEAPESPFQIVLQNGRSSHNTAILAALGVVEHR
jgi:hypothetical protein